MNRVFAVLDSSDGRSVSVISMYIQILATNIKRTRQVL